MRLAEKCRTGAFRASVLAIGMWAAGAELHADPGDALDTGGGGVDRRYDVHARYELDQGHFTAAIALCDRAIAAHPAFIRAHFDRGRALLASGRNDEAITEFTTVIAAHPEYPMVHIFRGEAYLQERKPEPAIAEFNTALTTERGMASAMAASVFALRSLGWEMSRQGQQSVDDLDRAMKALVSDNFHDYRVLNTRCYVAAVAGLLDSALESCNDSISRHPRDEGAYDSRGLTELKLHDWDHAVADYTQELYYQPDLSLSLYGRAIARQAKGDKAGSEADFAAARSNEPQVADIMARLGIPSDLASSAKPAK